MSFELSDNVFSWKPELNERHCIDVTGNQTVYSGTYEVIPRGTLVELAFSCSQKVLETRDKKLSVVTDTQESDMSFRAFIEDKKQIELC